MDFELLEDESMEKSSMHELEAALLGPTRRDELAFSSF
jgi:hypothetical protein